MVRSDELSKYLAAIITPTLAQLNQGNIKTKTYLGLPKVEDGDCLKRKRVYARIRRPVQIIDQFNLLSDALFQGI